MLYCPCRLPRSFSKRLPGGHFKSPNAIAPSTIASFRFVTLAGGEPPVLPVVQISAVRLLAKLLITLPIVTTVVNNVNRYYGRD